MANLLAHRLIIVVGKGGVGKTALSAAFALHAAERGGRIVAAETDRRAPLAALFGCGPSFEPLEARRRLAVVVLDGRKALEEYLRLVLPVGPLLNAVFSTKLYEHFVAAAPGLRELMILGKVYYAMELSPQDKRWETTIFDAPSSGQALGLLRMPFSARQTFSGGVVGREAENIGHLLQDHRATCAALVSTPDHLSVKETLDNAAALSGLGIKIGILILNRFRPARFNANDVKRLILRASRTRQLRFPEHVSRLAMREIMRAEQSSQALSTLTRHISAPALVVQDFCCLDGLTLVKQLCAGFGTEVAQRGAPRTREDGPRPNRKAATLGDAQAVSR